MLWPDQSFQTYLPGELVPLIGRHIKEIGPERQEEQQQQLCRTIAGSSRSTTSMFDVDVDADAELALCSVSRLWRALGRRPKSTLSIVPGRAEVSLKPSCASSTTHRTEYTPLESKCTIPYVR